MGGCFFNIKDKRKAVSNKPNSNTDENNSNTDNRNTTCQHTWITKFVNEEVTVICCQCACGEVFETCDEWRAHRIAAAMNNEYGHGSYSDIKITTTVTKTYEYYEKCGVRK